MFLRTAVFVGCLALAPLCPAVGAPPSRCNITLSTDTRGFFLSPVIARARITQVSPPAGRDHCELRAGDEVVKVNGHAVEGGKARAVMAYWNGLPKAAPVVFTVRRDGTILDVRVP